jgi:endonuclease YncB( thermonuclease family)
MARAAIIAAILAAGAAPAFTVTDGDTLRLGEERIRLKGIDAPETREPECLAEAMLGEKAKQRLAALLEAASEVSVDRQGKDRWGRTLAYVHLDGKEAGAVLMAEGLAVEWTGRRANWCDLPTGQ